MLNPFAGVIVVVAVLLFVVAWKGTQDNVIAALLGRQYGNSTLDQTAASSPKSGSTQQSVPATIVPD